MKIVGILAITPMARSAYREYLFQRDHYDDSSRRMVQGQVHTAVLRRAEISSKTNPSVSVPAANENTRGFELALTWYAPSDDTLGKWTKG